ncbi:MAG: ABC transporter ATP-binding protein [Candidatus Hydrothermarchaeales archaeon]
MDAIEVRELTKKYGGFTALDGISLSVEKGIICGLLGPNGAGKSTLIRVLSCQSRPNDGSAYVSNLDVVRDKGEVLSVIGVVPQEHSFYGELSVIENLLYFGSLYGVGKVDAKKRGNEILKLLGILKRRDSRANTLSGGMKTRLNIACALLHKPEVLILDEPSVGLDPVARISLWKTIRKLKKEGVTVLLTTHYMEEAEELCDRIFILNKGKVVTQGTPDELKKSVGEEVIRIKSRPGKLDNVKTKVKELKGISSCHVAKGTLQITSKQRNLEDLFKIFRACKETVIHVNITEPSLEDVFIHATGEEWQ